MILSDFLNEYGRVNSMKLRDSWMESHLPDKYAAINKFIEDNNISTNRFVEKVWYYLNNVTGTVTCKKEKCYNKKTFLGLLTGFSAYCSSKCSNSDSVVKNKKIQASLDKYGVENPYQSTEIIKKIRATNLVRHGVDNPMHSSKIKNEMIARSLKKTGSRWALSNGGSADVTKKANNKAAFEEKYSDLQVIEYSYEKFGICTFKKDTCGHTFQITKWQAYLRNMHNIELCTVCNPIGSFNSTKWQTELSDFLMTNNISFVERDRTVLCPFELDFYLPEHNIAIELDGLYWHSINFKEPKYHVDKTNSCESLGIQLIHIFEDEWIYRREIVLSRILNLVNKNKRRIFARKCVVLEISSEVAKNFINNNHIQGNIPSSKRYGLFFDTELVSVMTFGALRISLGSRAKSGEYEMYRFCNKKEISVVGGASKLLKFFINSVKPKYILSYADRRWSTGKIYKTLGFKEITKTAPNFWYVNGDTREHRFNYTRKKLLTKYACDPTKSTDTLLMELGLIRIYDSGNLKYGINLVY